jgi:hypothetical protein
VSFKVDKIGVFVSIFLKTALRIPYPVKVWCEFTRIAPLGCSFKMTIDPDVKTRYIIMAVALADAGSF